MLVFLTSGTHPSLSRRELGNDIKITFSHKKSQCTKPKGHEGQADVLVGWGGDISESLQCWWGGVGCGVVGRGDLRIPTSWRGSQRQRSPKADKGLLKPQMCA